MARVRIWWKRFLLRTMFTPVRALKLEKAHVRADTQIDSVHSNMTTIRPSSGGKPYVYYRIQVFYPGTGTDSLDCFDYGADRELFQQERQILEGLVVR